MDNSLPMVGRAMLKDDAAKGVRKEASVETKMTVLLLSMPLRVSLPFCASEVNPKPPI